MEDLRISLAVSVFVGVLATSPGLRSMLDLFLLIGTLVEDELLIAVAVGVSVGILALD